MASSLKDGNLKMLMELKHKEDGEKFRDLDKDWIEAHCGGLTYKNV